MVKNYVEIATRLIQKKYPKCNGAILAGSVVRDEATVTSDLDLIILDSRVDTAYRESFLFSEIPVEAFIHNEFTIREFFKKDADRARPSLPTMIVEGVVIKDCTLLSELKIEADELLENGPTPWNSIQIDFARYFITDLVDDLIGCSNEKELIFIAGALAEKLHEFYLRTNGKWIGQSKWIYRALRKVDVEFANEFATTFDEFYRLRDKVKIVELVDRVMKPFGGRLFDGFSIGKKYN